MSEPGKERNMSTARNRSADLQQPRERDRPPNSCRCIDWYSEGEARIVECNGVQIVVRYVGRKGRRGRIVIEAPDGASFS
jgi:hypothetical protein